MTRNANARITAQASQKNKFNFFWDEGLTCQDPCDGSVGRGRRETAGGRVRCIRPG